MKPTLNSRILLLISMMAILTCILTAHSVLPTDAVSNNSRFTETAPPVSPVRPVAEFEPASHVMISYPLGIPVSLVVHLSNTATVICVVTSGQQNAANTAFTNAGANMANITYMNATTDSYWTRDFGPWFIFDGNGDYGVVDFVYNRPRPNDNLIPQVFANQNGLNYYGMNIQQTGGNYMTDGINTAAQTTIAYSENGNNQTNVNNKMQSFLGITSYQVLQDPNNTYIDHIDCWGKFLAPDKVLIRSVPTSHAQYSEIEAMANYFATLNCAWGYPYKVYRVNTPSNQPYTNSLILNKKVFVPIMNGSYDAAALQVYRNAMPGYEVIGITGTTSAPWESTDALHCRTHEIPDKNMLHIAHQPLHGTISTASTLDFNTVITAHSGQALYSDSLFVTYKVNSGAWERSYLVNTTGTNYTTMLNGFAPGDTVRYFVHAADYSGRSYDHPVFAARDPHLFVIQQDNVAPMIEHSPLTTIGNQLEPVSFVARVTDNIGIDTVTIRYKTDNMATYTYPMESTGDGYYRYLYTPDFVQGNSVFYYSIQAFDTAIPPNVSNYPGVGTWLQVPIQTVANSDVFAPQLSEGIKSVYPNPFTVGKNLLLTLGYYSDKSVPVVWRIFNIRGQQIYEQSSISKGSGMQELNWNGFDSRGNKSTSGVYIMEIMLGENSYKSKLLLSK
ncbi:MAG: peptidyl-arginine deiminase [Candidatus Cloacimonetes bacterium HGW-Cloacimonetes-3]|jgi:agmatine/peptidylarginine deiminase|nr:MAG: peptidyl-arginine deiminase [Candidatus Cloacimonetes bacterium HGW-Cloacimonetes-3]